MSLAPHSPDGPSAPAGGPDLGALPEWDLSDLYPGRDSPALEADLAAAEAAAKAFAAAYRGRLAELDGAGLGRAIVEFERLDERLGRIGSYAQLEQARNLSDPEVGQFHQTIAERTVAISADTLFFRLELNQLDDATLERQLADPAAARYAPWVRDQRAFRPHQLSHEIETLLHERHVVGSAAWMRLFDETMADLRVPIGGEGLTVTATLDRLMSPDPAVRREAGQSFGRALTAQVRTFALITNTLAKEKEIDDRWRRYARPIAARNLANRVEDAVVDALVAAVRDSYAGLSHRYFRLKAGWLGVDALDHWDRYAPLPGTPDRLIPWPEARDIVLDAYQAFSPELGAIGRRFFDRPWIDAPARPGKAPGAFAHPTVPSAHPYLLVNYQGRLRDVMTLAHELGHGVHQVLAAGQGQLLADTPLTLAETASVFGEMLTFRALLARETDPLARRTMLAGKVEDMLGTVVRQVALHAFEARVHDERGSGELTPDRLGEIWLETQAESLGPAVRLDEDYRHYWAYIPHFIHAPFYVYAYAFGDCLVNTLYQAYTEAPAGFPEKYRALLAAGGSLHHGPLLAPFGLDARERSFWARGLTVVAGLIDELEALG